MSGGTLVYSGLFAGTTSMRFYAFPLIIGLATLLITASPAYLLGYGGEFAAPAGDIAQHLGGVYAYLDGSWRLPLFATDRINYPQGINIIFTDSVPVAGFLTKLVHSATGLRFNYLGLWFAVLWVGQTLSAAYLLRQLGLRNRWLVAAGSLLALMVPTFLYRHGHLALSSHFILLLGLGLYVRGLRGYMDRAWWIGSCALLCLAVWTHAYLFLMVYALFGAAVLDGGRRHQALAVSVLRALLASLPPLALAIVGGYLERGVVAAEGYHFFSMNLLSPVWPQNSGWLGGELLDPTGGQYEGFNYLGLGALAIIGLAAMLGARRLPGLIAASPVLCAVLVLMFLYSLSHHVWAGGIELVRLPLALDFFPFTTFRAPGRFFWPLTYVLTLGGFVLLALELERRSFRRAIVLLFSLVAVQVVDASVMYRSLRAHVRHENVQLADLATLARLIADHERVTMMPAANCWSRASERDIMQLTLLAARAGSSINVVHAARAALPGDCAEQKLLGTLPDLEPGELVIAPLREGVVTTLAAERYAACRFVSHAFLVCSGDQKWPVATPLPLELVEVPDCPTEMALTDAAMPLSRWFDGFGAVEPWGRWTKGYEARIMCRPAGEGVMTLTMFGYQAPGISQRVTFVANDEVVVTEELPRDEIRSVAIPVRGDRLLHLAMLIESPVSPEALGESSDGRALGIKLLKIEFDATADEVE